MLENKIIIVDDDEEVRNTLYKVVKSYGIEAELASSGEEALSKIEHNKYDCMLLDINLTGIDGFEVVSKIRAKKNPIPIIIVSARSEDYDTLYGLGIGADDYVTKPFNPVVLGAKVKATIRRFKDSQNANGGASSVIVAGPFTYDTSTLKLYKDRSEIVLTSKENAMMKLFMDNINKTFSKDMIYEMIWNETIIDENTIMVYINRLRQKIEEDPSHPKCIQNVRGIGYRFTP